jgi:hypothetical protein
MGQVVVKRESVMDVQKILTHTITQQTDASEPPAPSSDARSWRLSHEDGIWTLVEEYAGGDQSVPEYQGSVDSSLSTEPLETHARFAQFSDTLKNNWAEWRKNGNNGKFTPKTWTPETETDNVFASSFWPRWRAGIESYLAPRISLRLTALEEGPPDQSNVGMIDDGWSNIPGISGKVGTRNFILSGAKGNQEGTKWRNTYEWMGSDGQGKVGDSNAGQWDNFLYGVVD